MADYPLTCALSAIEKPQPDFAVTTTIADISLSLSFLSDDEWLKTSAAMAEPSPAAVADAEDLDNDTAATGHAADDQVDSIVVEDLDIDANRLDSNRADDDDDDGIFSGELWDVSNELDNGDLEFSKLLGEELDGVQATTAEPEVSPQPSETLADPNEIRQLSDGSTGSSANNEHRSSPPAVDGPAVDRTRGDSEGPPRKRRRNRKKQIVPAEICYTDLIGAAPQRPSFSRPQRRMNPSPPTTSHGRPRPSPTPLVPHVCGQTGNGYFIFVPTSGNMALSPMPWIDWDNFLAPPTVRHTSIKVHHNYHPQPQQQPSRNGPFYPPPVDPVRSDPRVPPTQQQQQQQITFAPATMPSNFVPNPNNHGRWSIDESGKRHYLNGAKNKRSYEQCS
ncbi:hypothetical protein VTN02DRAFT_1498 [Thermoascus thermophilus]